MTVHVGPKGIASDVCSAGATPTPDGLYVLRGVDGCHLGAAAAENVLSRVRRSSGDDTVGRAIALDSGLVELRGIDGVVVNRDTTRAVVCHVEEAGRCHVAVKIGDHPAIHYKADTPAAEVFAMELKHGHATIDDAVDEEYPELPNERLFS